MVFLREWKRHELLGNESPRPVGLRWSERVRGRSTSSQLSAAVKGSVRRDVHVDSECHTWQPHRPGPAAPDLELASPWKEARTALLCDYHRPVVQNTRFYFHYFETCIFTLFLGCVSVVLLLIRLGQKLKSCPGDQKLNPPVHAVKTPCTAGDCKTHKMQLPECKNIKDAKALG